MRTKEEILQQIKGGLIVSCQALPEEPLHSSYIMSRMAYAAQEGGAAGIRANGMEDIREIREAVDLPIIGIIKKIYSDCEVYITPTMAEVDALILSGAEIIAMDATKRLRPDGADISTFFKKVREKYPEQLFMADCSDYEEGMNAARIGFDFIGTTMSGYTEYTKGTMLPNYPMMKRLVQESGKMVIAEGGIWSPEQLRAALQTGVYAAVVGSAITRPFEITKRYVAAISEDENKAEN